VAGGFAPSSAAPLEALPGVVKLIVTDAGETLGTFRPGTAELLERLSPLPPPVIAEESRRVLHRTPFVTAEQIIDLCAALLIDPVTWPADWPTGRFDAYTYTSAVLDQLITVAPVVVLSNIPCTSGPGRMADLREQLPQVSAVYTSYGMQMRKPDHRLWEAIAADHGCSTTDVVHLGDQWTNDVCGAVFAGCRAIYVNTRETPAPPVEQRPAGPDRIGVTADLRGVPGILAAWAADRATQRES
jgi:FMN phosphatase YigB (HAD superfamily)